MVLDSDIDMVYLAFWTSDPLPGLFGSRSFEVRYRMAYVNWLLHCGTPISGFDLIFRWRCPSTMSGMARHRLTRSNDDVVHRHVRRSTALEDFLRIGEGYPVDLDVGSLPHDIDQLTFSQLYGHHPMLIMKHMNN